MDIRKLFRTIKVPNSFLFYNILSYFIALICAGYVSITVPS